MDLTVTTLTPDNVMTPIGPYSHIAMAGPFIAIGAVAGVDPATGELSGPDVTSQTRQIIRSFRVLLASVGSDLDQIMHINAFLRDMSDFHEMNACYVAEMQGYRPARTVVQVEGLPKEGALLTMNLTAVRKSD